MFFFLDEKEPKNQVKNMRHAPLAAHMLAQMCTTHLP